MASKILTPKSWTDAIKGSDIEGDDLEKALAKYESLVKKDGKPDDRIKAIDSISKLANELKGDVASLPKAKKYLAEVSDALKAEKVEMSEAQAGTTIEATILNNSNSDVYLTVEDMNLAGSRRWILNRERLNKKASIGVLLAADGDGLGQIHWYTQLEPDDNPSSGKRDEKKEDIKNGDVIKVTPP